MTVRYLSKEWIAEQWRVFEETQIAGDTSDCGGWGWDPPCGGCARCMTQQFGYYLSKEEDAARVLLRTGFDVADPRLISVDWWCHGLRPSHDSWSCKMSNEREGYTFPWES